MTFIGGLFKGMAPLDPFGGTVVTGLFPEVPKLSGPGDGPKAPEPPDKPPAAPKHGDPATEQAADEAARKAVLDEEEKRRKRSTVLTSPTGVIGEAPVTKKTLLGA